jgi:pimeloyl-ACP methyl ester carboxylesterase
MKERAGTVGRKGVAPLIDQAARTIPRIHLVGHSFGGRLVTAAAASSTTDRIKSMVLLQAAFSHNGFSRNMNGFFRKVVDDRRVDGPIIITHTKNDRAVGVAYPIASRLAGQKAAALGDENDVFGGIGRNGAQKLEPGETVKAALLDVDGDYALSAGKLFNLEASAFIKDHGDVRGRQVAYAILGAIK